MISLEQIRKNPEKVAHLRQIMEDAILQELIHAVYMSSPCTIVDSDISDTFSQIMLGAGIGHQRFHHLLLSGATHFETPASPQDAAMALEPED